MSIRTAITVDMWCTLPGADLGGSDQFGFLFTFGNIESGNGGRCIFLQPAEARLTMASGQPSWGTEESARFSPIVGAVDLHLTCVIDPPTQRMLVFTNGALAGAHYTLSIPMSAIADIYNYIGLSLFSQDGYRNVIIDEFRIWDGALTGLEIAGFDMAGPDDTTPATITVTSLTASALLPTVVQGGHTTIEVFGQASNFPYPVLIDNSFCTFISSDPNVLTVDANGVVTAHRPGTAEVTVEYGEASDSVSITVFQPETVLKHRYSFDGDLHDSVGGAAWDGTAPAGVDFDSIPGQAVLNSGLAQYIQFPSGIITNYTALTVEIWCSFPTFFDGNCFLWAFGNTLGGDNHGANYVFAQPAQGRVAISGWDPGWAGPEQQVGNMGNFTSVYTSPANQLHLTSVFNPAAGWMAVYTNGVLADQNNGVTWQLSTVHDVFNYIARSLYEADSYISVNVDEYRIYDGALTADQVAESHALGPNAVPDLGQPPVLSVSYDAGNVVLSWSTNATGFQLMSRMALTDPTWEPVEAAPEVSGSEYRVVLPASDTSRFFILSR